jgi:thioredoxin reductase (NADPH)
MSRFDKSWNVLIIGAGPIGLACAVEAKKRNISQLVIEKGCLVNSIFHYPSNMTFFSTSERLKIGEVPFISHGAKPTHREALECYWRVTDSWKLNIRTYEKVIKVRRKPGKFVVSTTRQESRAAQLIVANGYYDNPNLLDIPGEELDKVKHYYDEPHAYAYQRVAVIGAGNSAVDVVLELFRERAKVGMIIRESELKNSIKYWVIPDIENRIKKGSIKAFFNSNVQRILEIHVVMQTPSGQITLENDFVFAMNGYHPDFEFLRRIGISLASDDYLTPHFDPQTFLSNLPGIYLAGVVCGGMETSKFFIENS